MTPLARGGVQFELLRFEAAYVTGALVVLELEGRFRQSTRFGRSPVLVVEPGGERPRAELTPVHAAVDGTRWEASYVVGAQALEPEARLALGIRGTLLELPPPDEPPVGDRLAALAREANRLRRALQAAEADATAARAEAAAAVAERDAAARAAREEGLAASAARVEELEGVLAAVRERAEADAAAARAARADAEAAAPAAAALAEATARYEQAMAQAAARAEAAEDHAAQAGEEVPALRARLADSDAGIAVLRAELAEERERSQRAIAALEQELDAARTARPRDASPAEDDPDETQPFTVVEQRDADDDATQPITPRPVPLGPRQARAADVVGPEAPGHLGPARRQGPGPGRWLAVAALLLFAVVLVGLLLGLLP